MSSDCLLSDSSTGDDMDRSVSVVSLPMVIVENMDGETIDAGTWSGTGIPKDPIPKTCAHFHVDIFSVTFRCVSR